MQRAKAGPQRVYGAVQEIAFLRIFLKGEDEQHLNQLEGLEHRLWGRSEKASSRANSWSGAIAARCDSAGVLEGIHSVVIAFTRTTG